MITLLAPAKINVTLEILSRREDGYHALRSVMLPIALYDRIELEPGEAMRFSASARDLADGNLVMGALTGAGVRNKFRVHLDKTIPVGGGLGGGSSDAAMILRAAMRAELGPHAAPDWIALAQSLGSDVPFFLTGTGALVEGFGERVTALGSLPDWWVIVARPHASVSTADAYRRLDAVRERDGSPQSRPRNASASLAAVDALQRRDLAALHDVLSNDFHALVVAAYPEVANAAAALQAAGAERTLLSGSGSCLFALFADEAAARAVAARARPAAFAALFTVALHHDAAWR